MGKATKSVFLSKLSKKSEKVPLNLKGQGKSRNVFVEGNTSSDSYSMAGRTMIHQITTPTKYSAIHNPTTGLFSSYNRIIPKTSIGSNNRIRINKSSTKPASKIRVKEGKQQKTKSQVRSLRDGSPDNNSQPSYKDGYNNVGLVLD